MSGDLSGCLYLHFFTLFNSNDDASQTQRRLEYFGMKIPRANRLIGYEPGEGRSTTE